MYYSIIYIYYIHYIIYVNIQNLDIENLQIASHQFLLI